LIYDPKEWNIYAFNTLTDGLDVEFIPEVDLSHRRRVIKSPEEIELLKEASRRGREAFSKLAEEIDRVGIGESEFRLKYLTTSILSNHGDYNISFEPIVAINENSAKPHAIPSNLTLKRGHLLLVDAGLKYERYCSDRTRTSYVGDNISFGLEQRFKSREMQRVYDTVLKAHDVAISNLRAGMSGRDVDRLARDVIESAGYGKYFVHSTGHGVGLDIHEMPYISPRADRV